MIILGIFIWAIFAGHPWIAILLLLRYGLMIFVWMTEHT